MGTTYISILTCIYTTRSFYLRVYCLEHSPHIQIAGGLVLNAKHWSYWFEEFRRDLIQTLGLMRLVAVFGQVRLKWVVPAVNSVLVIIVNRLFCKLHISEKPKALFI